MNTASLVGRCVEANWGAMYPPEQGVITDTRVLDGQQCQVCVQWQDTAEWRDVTDIREPGTRSPNGSPIGVFWDWS